MKFFKVIKTRVLRVWKAIFTNDKILTFDRNNSYMSFDNDPPEVEKPELVISNEGCFKKQLAQWLGYKKTDSIQAHIERFNEKVSDKYKINKRGLISCHSAKMFLEDNDFRVRIEVKN